MDVAGLTTSLQDILYKSMLAAQLSLVNEEYVKPGEVSQLAKKDIQSSAENIAKIFSQQAANEIAKAMEKFVLSLKIQATPTKLMSPSGPVTGMINFDEIKLT